MFPRTGRSDRSLFIGRYWCLAVGNVYQGCDEFNPLFREREKCRKDLEGPSLLLTTRQFGIVRMGGRSQRASAKEPQRSAKADPNPPSAQRRTSATTATPAAAKIIRSR